MSRLYLLVLMAATSSLATAQGVPPSDPQAITMATQAATSLTGGSTISDVTLEGNAIWTLGSDEQSGSVSLLSKGFGKSRMDLNLSGGTRSEIRNVSGDPNEGNWIGSDGVVHAIALHNCFTDASWFFPASGALAAAESNPNVVLTYVGLETAGQVSVQHVHAYTYDRSFPAGLQLSAIDFYLDSSTLLPRIVTFNEHPDNDQTVNIAVQLMFADYRNISGAMVPFRIRRYVNNSLVLDLHLTSAIFNSGLADTNFNVQ